VKYVKYYEALLKNKSMKAQDLILPGLGQQTSILTRQTSQVKQWPLH